MGRSVSLGPVRGDRTAAGLRPCRPRRKVGARREPVEQQSNREGGYRGGAQVVEPSSAMDAARGLFLFGDLVKALRSGLKAAAGNARLLGWLLAGNLLLAILAVFPLLGPFEESLSHHEAAVELTRRFDMSWWVDLTTSRAEAFARALDGIAAAAFLAAMMGCFFAGGLIQAYQDTLAGVPIDRFMTSCRKWFARFIWLFLLSLPFYWLAHQFVNRQLAMWLRSEEH